MKIQEIESLDLIDNVTSIVFAENGRMNSQVQTEIENVWKNQKSKMLQDVIEEYLDTPDHYKRSVDIPTPQALIDMGTTDPGYVELRYWKIRAFKGECCKRPYDVKDPEGLTDKDSKENQKPDLFNNAAGRMDQCHFTELCVPVKNRLYRLELKSGREIPKYRDIQWLATKIGCTLNEADLFNKAFIDLQIGKTEIYKLIFGYLDMNYNVKTLGIQNTGNKHLKRFTNLQEAMSDLKLEKEELNLYQYDENGKDIDEEYKENIQDEDLIEVNFKEDLPVDANMFTFKRLSIPEESLSEDEIAKIKYADFNQYKRELKKYQEPKWKFINKGYDGKNRFKSIGKKITDEKLPTAVSMGWIYLNEKKEEFRAEKDKLVAETLAIGLTGETYEAIAAYKADPSKANKYRITTRIYGGTWTENPMTAEQKVIKISKASKGEIEIMWRVLYNKL